MTLDFKYEQKFGKFTHLQWSALCNIPCMAEKRNESYDVMLGLTKVILSLGLHHQC
jgi:hypothetical protein